MILGKLYVAEAIEKVSSYLYDIREDVIAGSSGVADAERKVDESAVTFFDKKIESDLRKILLDTKNGVGLYGEEFGVEGDAETFWTIDPIDGTEQYVRGNPFYTCMLSFVEAAVPRAALIYNYATDDLYTRLPDEQTMLNGEPIYVSDRPLDRSIVELEMRRDLPERSALIDAIDRRIYTNQKIAACAGFGMTQVIKGATEGRVQISGYGKLYDYLPGQILVDGAGGVVQTPGEDVWDWANLNSIVSNKLVAGELRNIIDGVLRAS